MRVCLSIHSDLLLTRLPYLQLCSCRCGRWCTWWTRAACSTPVLSLTSKRFWKASTLSAYVFSDRDWLMREARFELERRERLGLPRVDPDLLPVDSLHLPSEEELGDFEIVIWVQHISSVLSRSALVALYWDVSLVRLLLHSNNLLVQHCIHLEFSNSLERLSWLTLRNIWTVMFIWI